MEEVRKITGTKEFEEISRKKIQEYYEKKVCFIFTRINNFNK